MFRRILITGGAGLIGSHIAEACIARGYEVAVIDNLWERGGGQRSYLHPAAHFFQVDVTDEEALSCVFDEFQPHLVSHQAAQHDVFFSTQRPAFDARVNIVGLINVLQNCVRTGVHKIVFASSNAIYGCVDQLPLREETPALPVSPYGIAKLTCEHYLRYWQQEHELGYTILRYSNVYGPRQNPDGEAGVIAIFGKCFLNYSSLRMDWDGEQSKDYVYVEDIAHANLLALSSGDNEVFCLGTEQPVSVRRIYETLAQLTGVRPEIQYAPKRPGDVYLSYCDCSKAQRILGWQPHISFEEGVKETLNYLRLHSK